MSYFLRFQFVPVKLMKIHLGQYQLLWKPTYLGKQWKKVIFLVVGPLRGRGVTTGQLRTFFRVRKNSKIVTTKLEEGRVRAIKKITCLRRPLCIKSTTLMINIQNIKSKHISHKSAKLFLQHKCKTTWTIWIFFMVNALSAKSWKYLLKYEGNLIMNCFYRMYYK